MPIRRTYKQKGSVIIRQSLLDIHYIILILYLLVQGLRIQLLEYQVHR